MPLLTNVCANLINQIAVYKTFQNIFIILARDEFYIIPYYIIHFQLSKE